MYVPYSQKYAPCNKFHVTLTSLSLPKALVEQLVTSVSVTNALACQTMLYGVVMRHPHGTAPGPVGLYRGASCQLSTCEQ